MVSASTNSITIPRVDVLSFHLWVPKQRLVIGGTDSQRQSVSDVIMKSH